jgi:hypothetical protein
LPSNLKFAPSETIIFGVGALPYMIASIILMTIIVLAGMVDYFNEPIHAVGGGSATRKQVLIILGLIALGVGIALLWAKKR